MKRKEKKRKKRLQGRNKHHLVPKSKGGSKASCNILLIDIEKHRIWHKLFGNKTLDEVIKFLIRLQRAKRRQKCEKHHFA